MTEQINGTEMLPFDVPDGLPLDANMEEFVTTHRELLREEFAKDPDKSVVSKMTGVSASEWVLDEDTDDGNIVKRAWGATRVNLLDYCAHYGFDNPEKAVAKLLKKTLAVNPSKKTFGPYMPKNKRDEVIAMLADAAVAAKLAGEGFEIEELAEIADLGNMNETEGPEFEVSVNSGFDNELLDNATVRSFTESFPVIDVPSSFDASPEDAAEALSPFEKGDDIDQVVEVLKDEAAAMVANGTLDKLAEEAIAKEKMDELVEDAVEAEVEMTKGPDSETVPENETEALEVAVEEPEIEKPAEPQDATVEPLKEEIAEATALLDELNAEIKEADEAKTPVTGYRSATNQAASEVPRIIDVKPATEASNEAVEVIEQTASPAAVQEVPEVVAKLVEDAVSIPEEPAENSGKADTAIEEPPVKPMSFTDAFPIITDVAEIPEVVEEATEQPKTAQAGFFETMGNHTTEPLERVSEGPGDVASEEAIMSAPSTDGDYDIVKGPRDVGETIDVQDEDDYEMDEPAKETQESGFTKLKKFFS